MMPAAAKLRQSGLSQGDGVISTERSGILCTLADDADSCVAYGCGKSLAWINHMQEGPINIARKRIMRGSGKASPPGEVFCYLQ